MNDRSMLNLKISMRLLRHAANELAIEITPEWRSAWGRTERTRGDFGHCAELKGCSIFCRPTPSQ